MVSKTLGPPDFNKLAKQIDGDCIGHPEKGLVEIYQ